MKNHHARPGGLREALDVKLLTLTFTLASLLSGLALGIAQTAAEGQVPGSTASPDPFPLIGRTYSKAFCSSIRQSVAPAVLKLMQNDELIAQSHKSFEKMLRDQMTTTIQQPEFSGQADLGRAYLGNVIRGLANNLRELHGILNADRGYTRPAGTEDERLAAELRDRITNLTVKQNDALNLISGIVETELYEEMGAQLDTNMKSSTSPSGSGHNSTSIGSSSSSLTASPLAVYNADNLYNSDVIGHRRYDHVLDELGLERRSIVVLENALTPLVVASAKACASSQPEQSPTLSP